jgi:nucleotide-binding universal stress UspA family protein
MPAPEGPCALFDRHCGADDDGMVKTVIVPLDGSERAEAVLGPADWLAEALGADLVLVTSTFAGDTATHETTLAQALGRTSGRRARTEVLHGAYPAGDILHLAARSPDPMICMATHGGRALPTMVLGSVAHEVLTRSDAPMMLIGPSFEPPSEPSSDVVIAVQGGPDGPARFPTATTVAHDLGLRVHVLHVVRPAVGADGSGPVAATEARRLQSEGVDARGWDLVTDRVAPTVLALAGSLDARFLAMGCNECPDGIERTLGRTALDVLRWAPCPVLFEHPV